MEEWEAVQEQAKQERVTAKEGLIFETTQRRAGIYAVNYLMHQQEWAAWLLFDKGQLKASYTSSLRPHALVA
jgi:hypothetical protein